MNRTTREQDFKRLRSFLTCCAVALAMLMRYKTIAISNWLAEQCGMDTVMARLCVFVVMMLCCGFIVVAYALTYVTKNNWKKSSKS